jgi:prolyl oligopeptidase
VKARNAETTALLGARPGYAETRRDVLGVLNSKERIAYVHKEGSYYYNFWKDEQNPQGLWRRTTLAEFKKRAPKWDVLLDLDALSKADGVTWVWHGAQLLREGGYKKALVSLSRGGADAHVTRELDMTTRTFVKGGFELPEAKGSVYWIDADSVYVQTDFGPGSMTPSGYPRQTRRWRRGTPLASAELVYEGQADDVSIGAYVDHTRGFERH